ncbi:MAG: acetolactate synthase small subunit [Verrucomicrobia bacterium]|nr:acetolactate synthase small subunit [Verrucomicrobiota bacterium]
MRNIISALVLNKAGVLARIAGMFAARGFNIDSLVVGRTEDTKLSRMTIVAIGDDKVLEQIRKQLDKVIDVVKICDFADMNYVERDLMLCRVHTPPEKRSEVVEVVNLFRGRVVDVARESLLIELSGPEQKMEAFVDLIRPYGISELARTGVLAMQRGAQAKRRRAAKP